MRAFILALLTFTVFSSNAAIVNHTISRTDFIYYSGYSPNPNPISSNDTWYFDVWMRETNITEMRSVALYVPFDSQQSNFTETFEIRFEQGFTPSFGGRIWRGLNHFWVTYENPFSERNFAHLYYPLSFAPDEWFLQFRLGDYYELDSPAYFYVNGPVQVYLSDEPIVAGNEFGIPANEPAVAGLFVIGLLGLICRRHRTRAGLSLASE